MHKTKHIRFGRRLGVALGVSLLWALAGCNGGGDGGGSTPAASGGSNNGAGNNAGSSGNSSSVAYDYWMSGSKLLGLPRADFSAQPETIAAYSGQLSSWLFTQSSGAGASTNIDNRNAVLLYAANGRFYRLATAGASRPVPAQVSSETAADSICDMFDPQLHTPNNERATFKYQLPGKDQKCFSADDEYREIRLGMAANEAPLVIGVDRFRANEVYSAAGELAGYLVAASAGNIYWYDAGFANPRQIAAAGSVSNSYADFWLLGTSPDGRYRLLELFTSGIYVFDTATQKMTRVLDRGSYDGLETYAGFHYIYQSINGSAKSVQRVPTDGSALAQTVVTGIEKAAGIAGGSLIYQKTGSSGVDLLSLDLGIAGAVPRLIKTFPGVADVSVAGGRVYYEVVTRSGSTVVSTQAGSLKPDGSDDVAFDGAVWVGIDFRNGSQPDYPTLASDHLYLAQGVAFAATGAWYGGNLSWVDVSAGRIGGAIGAMPANVYGYSFASTDSGNTVLGIGYSADGNTTFYLRANRAIAKVAVVDQSVSGYNYTWKSDWSSAR